MVLVVYAICLGLALSVEARPDGTGGHHEHGHHADHGAAVAAPSSGYVEPSSSYSQPAASYGAPAASYNAPSAGYGAPDTSYASPSSGYGAPDAGYAAPDAGYGAPDAGYGAPDAGYGAPNTGYGAPVSNYDYEDSSAGGLAGTGIDLTTLIVPLLIIAGLALLFPSTITVPVNPRKRREAGDEEESGNVLAEKMLDIMNAVATSEQCMERIACEAGSIAADYGVDKKMTKSMTKVAEKFVAKKTHKLLKKFNGSEDCKKIKCLMF